MSCINFPDLYPNKKIQSLDWKFRFTSSSGTYKQFSNIDKNLSQQNICFLLCFEFADTCWRWNLGQGQHIQISFVYISIKLSKVTSVLYQNSIVFKKKSVVPIRQVNIFERKLKPEFVNNKPCLQTLLLFLSLITFGISFAGKYCLDFSSLK